MYTCVHVWIVYTARQAVSRQHQAGFLPTARKLDKLLTELEGKLSRASLTQHQQHWVMFTVLRAYLCCRQCFEVLYDVKRLPQVRAPAKLIFQQLAGVCCLTLCALACVGSLSYVSVLDLCALLNWDSLYTCLFASHADGILSSFNHNCIPIVRVHSSVSAGSATPPVCCFCEWGCVERFDFLPWKCCFTPRGTLIHMYSTICC